MAYRKIVLATNEIYHVYNRGVEKRPIFLIRKDYLRFVSLINYYRFANCPIKFSHFKQLSAEERNNILARLDKESKKLVNIMAFCLMPNHVHFLLRQLLDNGISKFMAKITSGFSHYFNVRHERVGHLFQGNFGAVRIENDEQFVHVSRYIHLNPVTSYLIKIEGIDDYDYSSFPEYIGRKSGFCNTKEILSYFKNADDYKKFVYDQADYAKQLENINHLTMEDE
jgi:putative transposase